MVNIVIAEDVRQRGAGGVAPYVRRGVDSPGIGNQTE